jgi:hypothetical protein
MHSIGRHHFVISVSRHYSCGSSPSRPPSTRRSPSNVINRFARLTTRPIGSSTHVNFDSFVETLLDNTCKRSLPTAAWMTPWTYVDSATEGSFSSDKKLSSGSVHEPRGVAIHAWGPDRSSCPLGIQGHDRTSSPIHSRGHQWCRTQ